MEISNDTVMYLLAALTAGYVSVSVVIELLSILFLFTPTEKDDRFIGKVKEKWNKGRKYIDWFSIRTPVTKTLRKILGALEIARTDIRNHLEKRKGEKKRD